MLCMTHLHLCRVHAHKARHLELLPAVEVKQRVSLRDGSLINTSPKQHKKAVGRVGPVQALIVKGYQAQSRTMTHTIASQYRYAHKLLPLSVPAR